ncbi:MAG: AraC family transcriptional regulator [Dokdonella sp.]
MLEQFMEIHDSCVSETVSNANVSAYVSANVSARVSTGVQPTSLEVTIGGGRGPVYRHAEGNTAALWVPLHGRLHVLGDAGGIALRAGEMLVSDPGEKILIKGRGACLWVSIIGSRDTWGELMAGILDLPLPEFDLIPARYPASRALRRAALELVRSSSRSSEVPFRKSAAALKFAALVAELQCGFDQSISQCPGRTHAQQRNVFLRLQRVRNYMAVNCHLDLDILHLASVANYSPGHFIRAFTAAFGKTPHADLVGFRLERALELIKVGNLAVIEVAVASGFENRSAFSRLFKQHFGVTAAAMRRSGRQKKAAA